MTLLLPDRVILISGGTEGIGAAIAAAAVREGARVVVTGRKGPAQSGVTFLEYDVADVTQARSAVAATVAANGRLDGLVTVAGHTARATLLDTTTELFDAHLAANLRGPFFLMQAAVADMVRRGAPGSIVTILSAEPHPPAATATAGLAGLIRNVAGTHRSDRIRVNGLETGGDDPGELVDTVVFLLSDRSDFLTGSVLGQDRGGVRD